jgi:hypothetical protein
MALRVARGEIELNDALKLLALRDEVERLIAQHGLDRALATQIARGQATLEAALRSRRIDAHLAEHRAQDTLAAAQQGGRELILGVHGRQVLRAKILACDAYEVRVVDLDGGSEQTIHKTRLKYACDAAGWQKARKAMTWDNARKAKTVEPILRPQDRYGCSNRRLAEAWDGKQDVVAVVLEGECFTGQVSWVARWEFGLRTRAGVDVTIFRHALDDFHDAKG